jgi:hypothetical protein
VILAARYMGRVAWRRRHASRHYVGYVVVGDDAVCLAGDELGTGIHAVLSIPSGAIRLTRIGRTPSEEVVGEKGVVLELADDEPIYVRPIRPSALGLDELARKLRSA